MAIGRSTAANKPEQPEGTATKEANRDESPTTANPTHSPGDNLAPLGTLSGNVLPPNGTGFHCGICGRVVGKEGQHYDEEGDVTETPHANVVVVADDWAQNQRNADGEALQKLADKKNRKAEQE